MFLHFAVFFSPFNIYAESSKEDANNATCINDAIDIKMLLLMFIQDVS